METKPQRLRFHFQVATLQRRFGVISVARNMVWVFVKAGETRFLEQVRGNLARYKTPVLPIHASAARRSVGHQYTPE